MIGWIDASSGASGDMLLGALVGAGVDEQVMRVAASAVAPESVQLTTERVQRGGLAATLSHVDVAESRTHRGLDEVLRLIEQADLDTAVAGHAATVFTRLGEAEASVHGVSTHEVHFHEVGALDAIADIVGVCAGLAALDLDELHCSPIAVGSGHVETAHGRLGVPPPAVVELLRGIPTYAGSVAAELCTPTGAALLSHWVDAWGPQPPMSVGQVGIGAGSRDFDTHPNVVRLLVGSAAAPSPAPASARRSSTTALLYETNVDDLDPRLWPATLQRLLDAGASDAWLTPMLMKKGRPAHVLSVLLPTERAVDVRAVVFSETSAIGLRETRIDKHALERETCSVEVDGQAIGIKRAWSDGVVVNVQPEYDDVAAAARILKRPAKAVLAEAIAQAAHLWNA